MGTESRRASGIGGAFGDMEHSKGYDYKLGIVVLRDRGRV